MDGGRASIRDAEEYSKEIVSKNDWIYAAGPVDGRLRRRALRHESFLDDCAYGIAELAAKLGPRALLATDDLRVSPLTMRTEKSGAKGTTLAHIFLRLYGVIFTLMIGFVVGSFLFVPAIILGAPTVTPVDNKSLRIVYSSPESWSISGNFTVDVSFNSQALVPVQLDIPAHLSKSRVTIERALQQFDSAVKLKGHKIAEGQTHIETDGNMGRDGDLNGTAAAGYGSETDTDTKLDARSESVERQEGGVRETPMSAAMTRGPLIATVNKVRDTDRNPIRGDEELSRAIMLAVVKPLEGPEGARGRCIGGLVHISESESEIYWTRLRNSNTLDFRMSIRFSAHDACPDKSAHSKRAPTAESVEALPVVSIESLFASCSEQKGVLFAVKFVDLIAFTTVTVSKLDGKLTPYVYLPCTSVTGKMED